MKHVLVVICVVALVLTLGTTAFAADQAQVRVINGVAGGKAVDVLIAEKAAFANVEMGTGTPYSAMAAGAVTIKVVATGTTTPVLAQADVTLQAGKPCAIFVLGTASKTAVVAVSDEQNVPTTGKALVRFANSVADVPNADYGPFGKTALIKAMKPNQVSDYVAVDPGSYQMGGCVSGTATCLPAGDPLAVQAGKNYTLVVAAVSALSTGQVEGYAIVDPVPAATAALPVTGGELATLPLLLVGLGGLLTAGGVFLRRR